MEERPEESSYIRHTFYYGHLANTIISVANTINQSYEPKEELWAAAEEKLFTAGVPSGEIYSSYAYKIIFNGIFDFFRENSSNFESLRDYSRLL